TRTNPNAEFAVVSNPEFLREGAAIDDFKHPDRIVIGGSDERGMQVMREVYRPLFLGGKSPMVEMSRRGAELTKYAGNAFLATKITFINEIADLCEKVGADVRDVARGIGLDNRIGNKFLNAGPGYGGSCFPKDTIALLKTAQDFEAPQR
ncbi:UDP-glucose/GDP-mannose dehydrogenase family protein, partial [Sphingomonas koreensis]